MSRTYVIADHDKARAYLAHPVLGQRLREITSLANQLFAKGVRAIFSNDDVKFHSCATLFSLVARIRGNKFQISLLRAGSENRGELSSLPRTEAILWVLRDADGTLGPSDISRSLEAAGRSENLRKVTATLDYLMKSGLVTKPDRGRYLAE